MMRERNSLFAAWSDTARFHGRCKSASWRMPRGTPLVEIVTWRAPSPMPSGEQIISNAGMRLFRLCIGSPMPITTTLLTSSPASRLASTTWSTISDTFKFRTKPCRPVSQNTQWTWQPTCVLTHTVFRFGARISTVSIVWPSCRRDSHLTVRSLSVWHVSISSAHAEKSAASSSRRAFGRFAISSKDMASFLKIQSCICVARKAGCPWAFSHSANCSFVCSLMEYIVFNPK